MPGTDNIDDPLAIARARASAAIGVMGTTNPDQHATALKLADKLGTAPEAAAAALRARPQQATDVANGADVALRQTRHLPAWLTDPHNAAIAHDDVSRLAAVERAIGGHKEARQAILGPGIAAGVMDADVGTRVLAAIVLNQPPDWAADGITTAEKARRAVGGLRPEGIKGYAFDATRGLVGIAPAIAGSFAGGATGAAAGAPLAGTLEGLAAVSGPLAPVFGTAGGLVEAHAAVVGARLGLFTGLGITSAGGLASSLLGSEVDLTDPKAVAAFLRDPEKVARVRAAAFKGGAVNAGVLMALQGLFPPGAAFEKAGGVTVGAAAKEMAVQTGAMAAANLAGTATATGKLPTGAEIGSEIAGAAGAALPFVVHGAVGAAQHAEAARFVEHEARMAEVLAVADHAQLTEAVKAAGETKVRTRNQERFEALVRSQAEGAEVPTVYINREGFDAAVVGAGRVPAVEAERLSGGRRAYEEAARTGVVEVPYERAMAVLPDDPIADALLEHATVRPGGLTLTEAQESAKARQKAAEEAAAAEPVAEPDPVQAAEDESRAAVLTAKLGVPEGADLLFQAARPEGEAAPAEEAKPGSSENDQKITAGSQPGDTLRAVADAIEAAPAAPGVVGRLLGKEAAPAAEAVRGILSPPPERATGAPNAPAGGGSAPVLAAITEPLAQSAARDPAGTAATLRELADIRDRQAGSQTETAKLTAKLEAAVRSAGRPAKEARAVARILSGFVQTMKARFPEVPAAKWDALMVRFAKSAAPAGAMRQGEHGAYSLLHRVAHMFETANATTALHESAHWMVDVIRTLAADKEAPEGLRQMWADLKQATGADKYASDLTIGRHEDIADAFVAYLFKGEAPSPALRRAFATMRDIMLRVYEAIRAHIGVDKLNPELRDVFDRMLATDAEIAAAEAEHGGQPVMTREEVAAETKNDHAALALWDANQKLIAEAGDAAREKMTRKVMADLKSEQRERKAATLANLTAEEARRYDESPAGVAWARLHDDIKLDRATLAAEYDKDTVAALEKSGVVADEGLSAQAAAEVFGFPSAGDLLNTLTAGREEVIDAAARRRLATEHPDLYLDPERKRAEARRAVAETDRGKITEAEIKALKGLDRKAQPAVKAAVGAEKVKAAAEEAQRRAAYDAIPTQAEARTVADDKIAAMPVGEIKPYKYRQAERKARTMARDRARVGDHLEAAQALGNALVQSEIHREAVRTVTQAGKDTRAIIAPRSEGRQVALGKAGGEWRNQVNMLAARFGLGSIRPDEAAETKPIADWLADLEKQAGTDGNVFIPFVAEWIKAERANDWTKLTGDQLHDLRVSVESMYEIGRDRSNAHAKGATDNLLDRAATVTAQVEASHPKPDREFQGKPTWPQKFAAEHSPIDRYVFEIDGGPGGPLAKAILFPRNEGEADLEQRRVAMNKSWKPAFAEFSAREKATMGSKQPVKGVSRPLSHENRLMVVLYEGHESGRQQNRNTFSESEIDAIKRTMTAADAHWLNETWRFSNESWPELKDHMQRNYGVVPPKVEALPFTITTDAGETLDLSGGYSKIKHFGERAAQQTVEEIAGDLARGAAVRSTVRLGARFERQQNVTRELRYDFGVVMEGAGEAATALALTERLYDINYVLRQSAVQKAIIERHGQEVYDQFKDAMAALAGGHLKRQSSGEQLANYLRTGTIIAKLGFKVGTQVLNATGLANSVEGLGPEVLKEAAQLSLDPSGFGAAVREMWAESSTMETRGVAASREQIDIRATLNKRFDTGKLRELPMMPMAAVQLWVDLPTYRVAKRKALAEGHSAVDAVRIAEQAVKDYQGSGFPADVPAIMRDHKYMTLFMGFLNRTINLGVRRANMTDKSAAGLVRLGATAVILFGVPAAVQQAYNRFVRDDDNTDPFWWSTAKDAAANLAGGVAWARDLVAAARYDNYGGPGSLSVIGDFGHAVRGIDDGQISERDLQAMTSLVGTVAWLPTAQAIEMWRGLERAMEGRASPAAIVTGPPRRIR